MPQRFRVRITSRFRRDAQKLLKQHPELVDVLEQLQATLAADPYNRSHEHDIKKLSGLSKGEGQWRIRVGIYRVPRCRSLLVSAPTGSVLTETPYYQGIASYRKAAASACARLFG